MKTLKWSGRGSADRDPCNARRHITTQEGDCVSWCPRCRKENWGRPIKRVKRVSLYDRAELKARCLHHTGMCRTVFVDAWQDGYRVGQRAERKRKASSTILDRVEALERNRAWAATILKKELACRHATVRSVMESLRCQPRQ